MSSTGYEDPFDNNASQAELRTEKIFSFIYLIRTYIPTNQLFYLLFYFLKFNVSYLGTNNIKGKEDDIISISTVLNYITIFGRNYCIFKSSYSIISLIVFCLLLLFYIFLFVFFFRFVKYNTCRGGVIALIYIFLILAFFSHYICEFLTPGILSYSYDSKSIENTQCKEEFVKKLVNDYFLPRYILTIINILSFILITLISYGFCLFMNSPTRSFEHGNLNFNYNRILNSNFATYILQGFITCSSLYSKSTENLIKLVICIGIVVLFLLSTLERHKTFNYYNLNVPLQYTVLATNISLIGGAIEIVLYFCYDDPKLPGIYYILKLIIMLFNSLLLTYYFQTNLNLYFINQLISKIFIEKNKMTPGELAMYDLLLYNYLNDKCDFSELYHIYHTHKVKCNIPKCPCKILEIDKWIDKTAITEDNEHYLSVKLTKKKEAFKFSSIKDFIEIAEYEIRKNILLFKKDKSASNFKQCLLILLHLDIIYLLKRDNCIAMYFCDRYRAQSKKIDIVTKYYLYEYKILISKELANVDSISSVERELNQRREMTRQMKEFYHYAEFMEKVKKMIINCIFSLETILKYKKLQTMKGFKLNNTVSCDKVLKISGEIQETNQKLSFSLKEYFKKKEPDNPELCILVCYYFLMLNQKAPKKMVRKLDEILQKTKKNANYDGDNEGEEYITQLAYDNSNISNPMIVILNTDDNFIIIHVTMKMCSILKEGKKDILKNDLHNYLPKDIVKMHKIIMKQFLLNSSCQFIKDTFITDKYSNLIPMKVVCNPLNTLETNFGLVINFVELEPKKSNFLDYYFLLNSEFHFLGINELFVQEYLFNLQMMKIIRLDFCSFFGIKADKLNLKMRNYFIKNKLTHKNELLEECNRELSVFTCSKMENLFSNVKINYFDRKTQPLKVKEKLRKKDIISNLTQLQQNVNDCGLDVEWYSRIEFFKERLSYGIENDQVMNKEEQEKEKKEPFDITKSFLNYFEAYYTINSIGDFYYIIVNLREGLSNPSAGTAFIKNHNFQPTPSLIIKETQTPGSGADLQYNFGKDLRSSKTNKSDASAGSNSMFINKLNMKGIDKGKFFRHQMLQNTSGNLNTSSSGLLLNNSRSGMNELEKSFKKKDGEHGYKYKEKKKRIKETKLEKQRQSEKQEKEEGESVELENRKLFERKKLFSFLSFIWKILISIQIFCCFLWIIFNQSDFKTSLDLYYINLYSMNIRTDIVYSSLAIFAKCGLYGQLSDENITSESKVMETVGEELRIHSQSFNFYLNNQIKRKNLDTVYNVLYEVNTFVSLLSNRLTKETNSSLYEEVNLYLLKVNKLTREGEFTNCALADWENQNLEANEEMIEIYYIIKNVITTIIDKFNELDSALLKLFKSFFNRSKRLTYVYIILAIFLEIVLMVIMQCIMSDHKANTQILLNYIYTPNKNDVLFEEDLFNYKELLFNFTKESFVHFRSMHRKVLTNEDSSNTLRTGFSLSTNENNLDTGNNSFSGDNNNNSKQKEIFYKFSDKATIPKHYFITMLSMYIASFVFIILELVYLLSTSNLYNKLQTSYILSMNYKDLVPKINELMLYTRISILTGNLELITVPKEEYGKKSYYYYYNNYEDYSNILEKFGETKFSFLYYQINQIRKNIDTFTSTKGSVLSETKKWNKNFSNENSDFCIYSSLGYLYFEGDKENEVDAFSEVNSLAAECKSFGDGFNLNNLNTILNAVLFEIEVVYTDFFTEKNMSDTQMITRYMSLKEMYLVEMNLKKQLKFAYITFVNFTKKDIDKLVRLSKTIGLVFAFCLMFSAGAYSLIVFLLLNFSNRNLKVLVYIKMFMKQALDSKGNQG